MGSKKVDGSSLHSALGHETQVLLGAIHVDDEKVCESDPAEKKKFHSYPRCIERSGPETP